MENATQGDKYLPSVRAMCFKVRPSGRYMGAGMTLQEIRQKIERIRGKRERVEEDLRAAKRTLTEAQTEATHIIEARALIDPCGDCVG